MSFNNMKTARPDTELSSSKIERPSTATIAKSQPQKSFIPTFRSLSQPPSISILNDQSNSSPTTTALNSEVLSEEIKNTLLENEVFNDMTMITDEFKDCLESVKLELDTPSNTQFDSLNLGSETAADILNNLKTPEEIETPPSTQRSKRREKSPPFLQRATGKGSAPIRSLSRKNSSSGIPVSVSLSGKTNTKSPPPRQLVKRQGASPASTGLTSTAGSKKQLSTSPSPTEKTNTALMVKRNMDIFLAKKKRYDTMRKDIQGKQKPLLDLYNALLDLKKKLSENGEQVSVKPMPPFENDSELKPKTHSVEVEANEDLTEKVSNVNTQILDDVKKSVEEIRVNAVELCKNMMEKRNNLLVAFENIAILDGNSKALLHELELHKNENVALEAFLSKNIENQEEELKEMVEKLTNLKLITTPVVQQTIRPPAEPREDFSKELQQRLKEIKELEDKIKQSEKQLSQTQKDLKAAQAASAAGQESGDALRSENDKLKQKITTLEKLIETEKRKAAHEVDRIKTTEMSSKTLKAKLKEVETVKLQHESKISQLNTELRTAQNKLKVAEKNFEKELGELNKSRNLDKSVIERLNRDKSTFETRLNEAQQQAEEMRSMFEARDGRMRQEVELARQECEAQTNMAMQMRIECENLRNELSSMHMHSKQSSELIRRSEDGSLTYSERECEQQVEIVAQRAAIKALQEKVNTSTMEKNRFIETIETLRGNTRSELHEDIVKTLVEKEEEITQLHQLLKKREDDLANRRVELQNLKNKVDNLQDHIQSMKQQDTESELKNMIKEGRSKLEDALAKSLENEHKLIKFEHEMAQKIQLVASLENTLKLRDGLIGVLKTKKEELIVENTSLAKYSEEIRLFVLEAKEELKEKSEIITQLQLALNDRLREIHKYEKRMQQMEGQLALTNEKRYRLQDTVSLMERELHMTKNGLDANNEIRYDDHCGAAFDGRLTCEVEMNEEEKSACECDNDNQPEQTDNFDYEYECPCDCEEYDEDVSRSMGMPMQPWQATSARLYNQYRTAYHEQRSSRSRVAVQSQSLGSISGRFNTSTEEIYESRNSSSGTFLLEDKQPTTCVSLRFEQPSCKPLHQCYANPNFHNDTNNFNYSYAPHQGHGECAESQFAFYPNPENCVFGPGQYYQPITLGCVDTYQVADSGHLVWLTPSATMQANNAIITRDLFTHSCTKLKNNLKDSLRRLEETRASYS